MSNRVSTRQLAALALCAMTVPVFFLCAGMSWQWVLLGALLAGIYYYIMSLLAQPRCLPELALWVYGSVGGRLLLLVCGLYFLVLVGFIGAKSALAFPETVETPWAGILILLLAAAASRKGISGVVRCTGLLLPVLGVIYVIVLAFSAPKIQADWLRPYGTLKESGWTFLLLSLPTTLLYFQKEDRQKERGAWRWLLAGGILAVAVPFVTAGCLSPALATQELSFYVLARSVSLLGVMERFEALVSAAYLIGFFCLAALLFCVLGEISRSLFPRGKENAFIPGLFLLSLAAGWLTNRLSAWIFVALGGIFCGLLPLATQLLGFLKKFKNLKKSC